MLSNSVVQSLTCFFCIQKKDKEEDEEENEEDDEDEEEQEDAGGEHEGEVGLEEFFTRDAVIYTGTPARWEAGHASEAHLIIGGQYHQLRHRPRRVLRGVVGWE